MTSTLELRDVWRRYRLPGSRPTTLRAAVARRWNGRSDRSGRWFWALQGVDLEVAPGTATAIVGPNGAGKSTLLRLAGGVGRPDRGDVLVRGRVGAMLDLGREFHPDLTGRENAEVAAVAAGLTRREFAARLDDVVAFAELADFLDEPLRAYSDGMRARLAFSVLAELEPDLLLVDEVLAVGDASFQRRSVDRIEALRRAGAAILFVSHDMGLVRRVCDQALWLEAGTIRERGDAGSVVASYLRGAGGGPDRASAGVLSAVRIEDAWGAPTSTLRTGEGLTASVTVDDPSGTARWLSVFIQRAADDLRVVDTSTPLASGSDQRTVTFHRLDLTPGRHEVVVAVHDRTWRTCLGEHRTVLDVDGEGSDRAPLAPPHDWRPGGPTR